MNNLKVAREAKGLTQTQVAEQVGIATMTYVRYENPKYRRYPDVLTGLAIAETLGTTVKQLWGDPRKPIIPYG